MVVGRAQSELVAELNRLYYAATALVTEDQADEIAEYLPTPNDISRQICSSFEESTLELIRRGMRARR